MYLCEQQNKNCLEIFDFSSLYYFICAESSDFYRIVVICGEFQLVAVVCSGLRWFAVVCGIQPVGNKMADH